MLYKHVQMTGFAHLREIRLTIDPAAPDSVAGAVPCLWEKNPREAGKEKDIERTITELPD